MENPSESGIFRLQSKPLKDCSLEELEERAKRLMQRSSKAEMAMRCAFPLPPNDRERALRILLAQLEPEKGGGRNRQLAPQQPTEAQRERAGQKAMECMKRLHGAIREKAEKERRPFEHAEAEIFSTVFAAALRDILDA